MCQKQCSMNDLFFCNYYSMPNSSLHTPYEIAQSLRMGQCIEYFRVVQNKYLAGKYVMCWCDMWLIYII